jgi:hypothetical protein
MWIRWIRIRIRNTVSSTYWYLLYVPDRTFLCTVPPGADSLHVQVPVQVHTVHIPQPGWSLEIAGVRVERGGGILI